MRTPSGIGDELAADTLEIPQVQDDVFGQSGRQDGLRRGQAGYCCRSNEGDGGAWMDWRCPCCELGRNLDGARSRALVRRGRGQEVRYLQGIACVQQQSGESEEMRKDHESSVQCGLQRVNWGWSHEKMREKFRFRKKEEEEWQTYRTRTSVLMRRIWETSERAILGGDWSGQYGESHMMGDGYSKCSSGEGHRDGGT